MRQIVGEFQKIADREIRSSDMMASTSEGAPAAERDFMEIIEPLKKDLEEIKRSCEELEQRSAELQAGITLTDMEECQSVLRRVSEDRREIMILPHLCSRVVEDCEKMKKELKDFTE
ncbi:hypothetical protein EPR50_G00173740 [Perca flavescens]|uniref:Uncharacterized protein n=1 Tax=Perca flavescens TaxID=8167 RepID=A0A484CKR2_PERFV|nr:hypothetical protein EPR50_G00173740 [Perca flavescens]